jgi:hypothetical protein
MHRIQEDMFRREKGVQAQFNPDRTTMQATTTTTT